ncbi:MAG: PE-PPE domain-containing protein [Mycobacterium sp.]
MGVRIRTGVAVALAAITLVGAAPADAASATTTLSMGGTLNPLSVPPQPSDWVGYYIDTMNDKYVRDTGLCATACTRVGVYTPEEMGWLSGLRSMTFDASVAAGMANLDKCVRGTACVVTEPPYTRTITTPLTDSGYVVFGYSQSATIAGDEKAALIADPTSATVNFVMLANPNRPDGGILARVPGLYIPFLGVTFNGATPTDSPQSAPLTTVDVAGQYDLMSDSPNNPFNLLAMVNAVAGYYFVHLQPLSLGTPELQGQYQDSTYYLIPTPTLPMLMPVAMVPLIGPLIAAIADPPLRVLIETAYDRTINPGTPTMANPLYFPNPIKTLVNFLTAIPVGWDNGIAYLSGNPANRPFGTTAQGVYGVGGPPVYAGAVDPYGPPTPYTPVVAPVSQTAAASVAAKALRRSGSPSTANQHRRVQPKQAAVRTRRP